jgi:hypothetical protein
MAYAAVLDAVTAVLPASHAIRYIEVHALVEEHLGQPVLKSTVRNALASHSRGPNPRFVRVGHGLYRLDQRQLKG